MKCDTEQSMKLEWLYKVACERKLKSWLSFTVSEWNSVDYINIDLKKGILLKKIRKHSKPLKLQQNIKICHKFR